MIYFWWRFWISMYRKRFLMKKIIGKILYQNKSDVDVKELLVNGKQEIIELNHEPWDILA